MSEFSTITSNVLRISAPARQPAEHHF